ncbi:MAG TPA: N-6 DNA methylase [Candidatus Pelethosoma merdigallinarum]|jgi:type I restriction-modification system M subunit|nr:N-6 DNA methylase [Candidatus Pelethosoma merdigallinarum]
MNIGTMIKRLQDIMRQDAGVNGDAQRIEQIVWMLFLKLYDAKESEWEILEDDYRSIIPEKYRWRNWAPDNKDGKAMTGDELSNFIINLFNALKELEINETTPIRGRIVREVFEDLNNYMKDGVLIRQVVNVLNEIDLTDFQTRHAFNEIYETILKDLQSAGKSGEFYTPRAVTDFVVKMVDPKIGESVADFACGTGGFLVSALNHMKESAEDTSSNEQLKKSFYGVEKKSLPYLLCTTNMLLHDINEPNIIRGNSLEKNVRDYEENDKFDIILMNPPYGGTEKKSIQQNFPTELRDSETADLFIVEILYRLKENGKVGIVLPDGFLASVDSTKVAIKKKLMEECKLHTIVRLPGSIFAPYTPIATNLLFFDKTGSTDGIWYYRMDLPKDYKAFSKTKPVELKHFNDVINWWDNRKDIKDEINSDDDNTYWKSKYIPMDEIINNGYNLEYCNYPVKIEKVLNPKDTINTFIDERESLENELKNITTNLNDYLNNKCDEFNYDNTIGRLINQLIDVNMNFPKKMKNSIVQYAIEGKFDLSKTGDSSVIETLQSISEKRKLIDKKRLFDINAINEAEVPFVIPNNWKWVRLSELVSYQNGYAFKSSEMTKTKTGVPVIKSNNLMKLKVELNSKTDYISNPTDKMLNSKIIKGDLLMCLSSQSSNPEPLGKTAIYDMNDYALLNQRVLKLTCLDERMIKFLYYVINSFYFHNGVSRKGGGSAQSNLKLDHVMNMMVPLPPIEEQQRIVNKLDIIIPVLEVEFNEQNDVEE